MKYHFTSQAGDWALMRRDNTLALGYSLVMRDWMVWTSIGFTPTGPYISDIRYVRPQTRSWAAVAKTAWRSTTGQMGRNASQTDTQWSTVHVYLAILEVELLYLTFVGCIIRYHHLVTEPTYSCGISTPWGAYIGCYPSARKTLFNTLPSLSYHLVICTWEKWSARRCSALINNTTSTFQLVEISYILNWTPFYMIYQYWKSEKNRREYFLNFRKYIKTSISIPPPLYAETRRSTVQIYPL